MRELTEKELKGITGGTTELQGYDPNCPLYCGSDLLLVGCKVKQGTVIFTLTGVESLGNCARYYFHSPSSNMFFVETVTKAGKNLEGFTYYSYSV